MDELLALMKDILDITSDRKDSTLKHYLTRAERTIEKYCGDIPDQGIIVDLAIFYFKNPDGIKSESKGGRAKAITDGIPQNIKDSLPLPKIKVVG